MQRHYESNAHKWFDCSYFFFESDVCRCLFKNIRLDRERESKNFVRQWNWNQLYQQASCWRNKLIYSLWNDHVNDSDNKWQRQVRESVRRFESSLERSNHHHIDFRHSQIKSWFNSRAILRTCCSHVKHEYERRVFEISDAFRWWIHSSLFSRRINQSFKKSWNEHRFRCEVFKSINDNSINVVVVKSKFDHQSVALSFVRVSIIIAQLLNFISSQVRFNDIDSIRVSTRWINQTFANHVKNDLRNILFTQSLIESSSQCFLVEFQLSLDALSFVRTFKTCSQEKINYYRFFKKFDLLTTIQRQFNYSTIRVDTMYKRKTQKITFVNFNTSNEFMLDEQTKWKKTLESNYDSKSWKKLIERFEKFLTFKFCIITREARLTSKRIDKLIIKSNLWSQERKLLLKMLYKREKALSWIFDEIDKVRKKVTLDQEIKIIEHETWQVSKFLVSRALTQVVINMLRVRIKVDLLKSCHDSYRNSWFLIDKKKKRKYRMINATMKINDVIIRDANLLSNVKKFVEKFANMTIASLIDFFFDYDQLDLTLRNRNIIAFQTSLDLLRFTRLSQKAINSMTQFVKIVTKILKNHLRTRCKSFLDDIEMKESRSRYDDREVASSIRFFVLEHIQWLDVVLVDLELANVTISKEKSQWCMNDLKIVEFVCDSNDRSSNNVKIIKIVKWSFCVDVFETRTFIDVCVYYRIWVKNFVLMIESIYRLFKFEMSFV